MKNMLMRNIPRLILLSLVVSLFGSPLLFGRQSAFAGQDDPPPLPGARIIDPPADGGMLTANTYAGDAIAAMLLKRMSAGNSILNASMVEMDRMDQSSAFGRLAMQQVSSRVAQHGFRVIDVHLTEAMIINNNGEFMLSRDVCKILADKHNAYAVLVGTYTPAGNMLYVSVRALRLSDATVIAAYEYYLPLNSQTRILLGGGPGGKRGAGGDPVWSRYAARGQAFPNCPPQKTAATPRVTAPAVAAGPPPATIAKPAPKVAPKRATSKKSPVKKRRAVRSASARSQRAPAPRPAPPSASYSQQGEPICPQDVPSNRRSSPGDCYRNSPSQNQAVYGEPYIDRGGGRAINPSSPPPAVGRAY